MEGTVARRALRVSFYLPCTRQSFHASGYLVLCGHRYHSVGNISLPEPGPWTNAPLELTIYYRICIVNKRTPLEHAGLPSISHRPSTRVENTRNVLLSATLLRMEPNPHTCKSILHYEQPPRDKARYILKESTVATFTTENSCYVK